MKPVDLLPQANQVVSFVENNISWRLKLSLMLDRMVMDVEINQAPIHHSISCDEGKLILPYVYQYQGVGNLIFIGKVDYLSFNQNCLLYYLDPQETKQFNHDSHQQALERLRDDKHL